MKRKRDKKRDNEEPMVFRQDFECPPSSLDGAVLLPDGERAAGCGL